MNELNAYVIADLLRESMARGEQPALTLTSNSMYPLLKVGDQIRIEPAAAAALQPGDVVTFINASDPSQLMTHRYWGSVQQNGRRVLMMRGDRPACFDPPCAAADLVGRVVARCRNGRDLNLESGSGRWLNRQLAGLAAREMARLTGKTGQPLSTIVADAAANTPPNNQSGSRLYRRINLAAGLLLTAVVNLVNRT